MLAAKDLPARTSKKELIELLEFIYCEVYPEGYSADAEENARYRDLCRKRKDELAANLPDTAEMVRLSEIVATPSRNPS
jgi:hypothetical protein